jgi:N-acetylglucosaminyldiphosphoundecaprenol N-acetyl-beta-D-mannosaminyltransferase
MPTPRKERFLASHRDALGVPFIMGVGGSLDILAGAVRRAPLRMQRLGLEWLYRVCQEPGRMWWRYAKTNTLFAGILAQAIVRQRLGMAPQASSALPPGTIR